MQANRLVYFAAATDQQNSAENEHEKEKNQEEERQREDLSTQIKASINRLPVRLQEKQKQASTETWLLSAPLDEMRSLLGYLQKSENIGQKVEEDFRLGKILQSHSRVSEHTKGKVGDFMRRYEAGQTTEKEHEAFSKLIQEATKNLPEREQFAAEFAAFSALPGVELSVAKLKLDSGGGKTVEGLVSKSEFEKLPTGVQKNYLTKLREEYKRRVENYHPDVVAKNQELQSRDDVPLAHKSWLNDKTTSETLKYKVDWEVAHLPELQLQASQFEQKAADSTTQKAFQKKGESILALNKFKELTRDEREREIKKLEDEKAKYEQEFGIKKETAESADQQKVTTGQTEMQKSAEAESQAETQKMKVILEHLKVSALNKRTQELYQKNLAKADDQAAQATNSVANLRQQAQQEEGGFLKNLGRMVGFGKPANVEARESKDLREQSARQQATQEVMQTKESQDEFKKIVGITPDKELKPGELERLAGAFLSSKNLEDPREVRDKLLSNEELRQLALRVANLDVRKLAA